MIVKQKGGIKTTLKIGITIDWDYFSDSDIFDYGHRENQFFREFMWNSRLQGNPGLVDEFKMEDYKAFVDKLKEIKLLPKVIWVSDSHLYAAIVFTSFKPDIIINFDSHHDMYLIKEKYISCENWAVESLKRRKKLQYIWVRPAWVKEADGIPKDFIDRVKSCHLDELEHLLPESYDMTISHACRSGSWMPPWLDDKFDEFLKLTKAILTMDQDDPPAKRTYHVPTPEEFADYRKKIEMIFNEQKQRDAERI